MTLTKERANKRPVTSKHQWTEDELGLVRLYYDGTRKSVRALSRITGASYYGVKGQIQKLGLARVRPSNWSEEELEYLEKNVNRQSIKTIARALGRSVNAVKVKSARLHYKLRYRDGWYTKKEVAEICGVDHKKVQTWIERGDLKATWHTPDRKPTKRGLAMWHIEEKDLALFIKSHCQEMQGRNIDIFQILTIFGVLDSDN